MKTNAELETLIQNLIGRVNRIEAMQAHQTNRRDEKIVVDIDASAVTQGIEQIEKSLKDIEDRRLKMLSDVNRWKLAKCNRRDK